MRKGLSVALIAGLLGVVGMSRQAEATITIELEWGACGGGTLGCSATGGNTIAVDYTTPGVTLRLDVYLSHNLLQGVESHSFSLNFDTGLSNELNLGPMASVEWSGSDVHPSPALTFNYGPFSTGVTTLDSTGSNAGRVNSFESAGIQGVLPANGAAYTIGTFTATAPARYRVGQAFFATTGVFAGFPSPQPDVFSGLFNLPGILDVFLDGNGNPVAPGTIVFGTATVNALPAIPEPGTVWLLGLGGLGLALAARRSRRR